MLKKLLFKFLRLFKGYPTLSVFLAVAKEKQAKNIIIQPRIIIIEFPISGNYILSGQVEVYAEEILGSYLTICYEALVKSDDAENFFMNKNAAIRFIECENTIKEYSRKIEKKIREGGFCEFVVVIKEVKVQ